MSEMMNRLNNVQIPNIAEILKSAKKTKSQMDNIKLNDVNVHFLYSDNRFKITVKGTLVHIAEIPMIFIEYPAKLGFIVLNNSLIHDVTNNTFEIFVNESFTHTVVLNDIKELDINNELKELISKINLIVPISPNLFKYEEIKVSISSINNTKEQIKLLPTFLSSLGRAKLLENTTETTNDGLIIVGIIGFLMGLIVGIIGTIITVV